MKPVYDHTTACEESEWERRMRLGFTWVFLLLPLALIALSPPVRLREAGWGLPALVILCLWIAKQTAIFPEIVHVRLKASGLSIRYRLFRYDELTPLRRVWVPIGKIRSAHAASSSDPLLQKAMAENTLWYKGPFNRMLKKGPYRYILVILGRSKKYAKREKQGIELLLAEDLGHFPRIFFETDDIENFLAALRPLLKTNDPEPSASADGR